MTYRAVVRFSTLLTMTLVYERSRLGITQVKMADLLEVHQSKLSRMETSYSGLDVDMAYKYAEVLGIKLEDLLFKVQSLVKQVKEKGIVITGEERPGDVVLGIRDLKMNMIF